MISPGSQDVVFQATKLLHESPFPELHGIAVEQQGEKVCLRGEVQTYFLKQLAQETVRSATRGLEVRNELLVELRRRIH
ncbi:MAG: BON domain-containing protein [Planctomycetota bacterium]|jgi:osmotically-inducible protein OsmY